MPNIHNALKPLTGKTVKSVKVREADLNGDKSNVMQVYVIECTDGSVLTVTCDGGCDGQYARLATGDLTQD